MARVPTRVDKHGKDALKLWTTNKLAYLIRTSKILRAAHNRLPRRTIILPNFEIKQYLMKFVLKSFVISFEP